MKKRKLLTLFGSICLVLVLVALLLPACAKEAPPVPTPPMPTPPTPAPPAPAPPAPPPEEKEVRAITLRVGSSKEGTAGYTSCITLSRIVDLYAPARTKCSAIATAGSIASQRLLDRREIDIAYTGTVSVYEAAINKGAFEENPVTTIGYTGLFYTGGPKSPPVVLSNRDDIQCIADLAGKTVVTSPGWGLYPVFMEMYTKLGIYGSFNQIHMPTMEIASALNDGTVDLSFTYLTACGLTLASWLRNVDERCDIKMVPWTQEEYETKLTGMPGFVDWEGRPKQCFTKNAARMPESVMCPATTYGWFFAPWVEEVYVYDIMKAVCENIDDIESIEPKLGEGMRLYWKKITVDSIDTLQEYGVLVHPGAARYLKEVGLWQEGWEIGPLTY